MRFVLALASVIFTLSVTTSAEADRRVAFVLGNGAYRNVDPLPNPPIDARAMASLLRNVGFEVVEGTDLGRDAMTSRLREFALKSQGADIALFYYAGHGIAVNGKNYLIPVDADLRSEMDVKFGAAIDVDVTLEQTMADAKVKLILLDACRDNPFAAKIRSAARTRNVVVASGLAEMKSAEGTLIAFATGPGQTALDGQAGGNSPFTRALLNHIGSPGVEIQQAMTRVRAQVNDETQKQQLPWGHTNLIGSVYLNPTNAVVASAPAEAPAPAESGAVLTTTTRTLTSEVEIEFWRSIKDSNKPEELNAYLVNYPNGQFKSLALARLAALQAQPSAPGRPGAAPVDPAVFSAEATLATEDTLGLDRGKRREVQRRLTRLGFDTKVTGRFEESTRRVIARWQTARGYPSTGFFNKPQYQALMAESLPSLSENDEERPAPRATRRSERSASRARASGGVAYQPAPIIAPPVFNLLGGGFRRR